MTLKTLIQTEQTSTQVEPSVMSGKTVRLRVTGIQLGEQITHLKTTNPLNTGPVAIELYEA